MEIDTIKDLWNVENSAETPAFILEKKNELRMPLEKIRKNMRMEFWISVFSIIPLIFVGFFLKKFASSERFIVYYVAFVLSFLMVISFYFFKFFRLYKDLETLDLNMKDSLKDLIWKFKLNEQYYLSYYVATVPVMLFELAIFMDYLPGYEKFSISKFIYSYSTSALIGLFILYNFGKWWFRKSYGKYIYQIKKTLQIIEIQESAVK